ncbi:MAG: NADPH-dependent curcumin reductase CurA [Paracoccaceae bacterium]|jgi:NADPH-dependent curcumin reductase CurA
MGGKLKMTIQMHRIALASRPEGAPFLANFRYEPFSLPDPGKGEVLLETQVLSLDPYMRGRMSTGKSYANPVEIGATMEGAAVGKVLASGSSAFKPGDYAVGMIGWASHGVLPAHDLQMVDATIAPLSTALGVLGMPGFTGWHGLNAYGRPKAGETLVVGAATGAVGSMVGQLAKHYGLRAVGVAGGAEKCTYAVEKLGFDACIDHRAAADPKALRAQIAAACPDGIDIYFENVGDKTLRAILPLMNVAGRIPICGTIGWYDLTGPDDPSLAGPDTLPLIWRSILVNRLSINGFIILDNYDRYPAFVQEVTPLVLSGQIKHREDIANGLQDAPAAFLRLLSGKNFGKQLVQVAL